MLEYSFERECRTPYSELYSITTKGTQVGRVDLHFTPTVVHATLCVGENLTADDIQDLIDFIDEKLVLSSEMMRDDFIVAVYQGREAGVFSDEDMAEEEISEDPKW